MTSDAAEPATTRPTEAKVLVPSATALVVAVLSLLAAFGAPLTDGQVSALLAFVVAAVPVVVFLVGYFTKHTPRPDLGEPDPWTEPTP